MGFLLGWWRGLDLTGRICLLGLPGWDWWAGALAGGGLLQAERADCSKPC